MRKQFKRE